MDFDMNLLLHVHKHQNQKSTGGLKSLPETSLKLEFLTIMSSNGAFYYININTILFYSETYETYFPAKQSAQKEKTWFPGKNGNSRGQKNH